MINNNRVPYVNFIFTDKLSIYRNGRWEFVMPGGNIHFSITGKAYMPVNYKFGIVESNVGDPSVTRGRGNPGDILAWNNLRFDGYSIVAKAQYDVLFPPPKQPSTATVPISSTKLREPNFYNNVVAEYERGSSNIPTGVGSPSLGGSPTPSTGGGSVPSTGGGGY